MTDPTKGLRLVFQPGFTGLKFTAGYGAYPEDNGPTDMAYINSLIEADERRREESENAHAPVAWNPDAWAQTFHPVDPKCQHLFTNMLLDGNGFWDICIKCGGFRVAVKSATDPRA